MRRGKAAVYSGSSPGRTNQSKIVQSKSNQKIITQTSYRQVSSSSKGGTKTTMTHQKLQTGVNLRNNKNLAQEKRVEYKKINQTRQRTQSPAEPRHRREERIIQTRKRKEYIDNFQYHEIKDIKNKDPNKQSVVTHNRLGEIIGDDYEQRTYERRTEIPSQKRNFSFNRNSTTKIQRNNMQNESERLRQNKSGYKTLTQNVRRGANIPKPKPVQPYSQKTFSNTQRNQNRQPQIAIKERIEISRVGRRNNTGSRDIPSNITQIKKEVKQYTSNTNRRNIPFQQQKITKTTRTISNIRGADIRGNMTDIESRKTNTQQRGNRGNSNSRQKVNSRGRK